MATIVLPTKNRPTALSAWLYYMQRFYPRTEKIIIAEGGSKTSFKKKYDELIIQYQATLNIEYLNYPETLSYYDRMIDVLTNIDDEFIIPSTDDDFPIMDALLEGEDFLVKNAEYTMVLGPIIMLCVSSSNKVNYSLMHSLNISNDNPFTRIKQYCEHPFPTYYAVIRRNHLIERTAIIKEMLVSGFGDFLMGIYDCSMGKIKSNDNFCYIKSHNSNHSYYHHPNIFTHMLQHGKTIIAITNYIASLLHQHANLNEKKSLIQAKRLVMNNMGRWFGLISPNNHQITKKQQKIFSDLFDKTSKLKNDNNPHYDKLVCLKKLIRDVNQSDDNGDEPKRKIVL